MQSEQALQKLTENSETLSLNYFEPLKHHNVEEYERNTEEQDLEMTI